MRKLILYIVVILLLFVVNLYLFFSPRWGVTESSSRRYFENVSINAINQLRFTNDDHVMSMRNAGDNWVLNDSLKVDEGFINTLLAIIENLEVTRKMSLWEGEYRGEIEIETAERVIKLKYGTNTMETKSYFISGAEIAEVTVPGYRDNVITMFELHPDQWRDRLIVDASWRTIQKIQIDYTTAQDIAIQFQDKFFIVNEEAPKDSAAVVAYLNQFQYFQANEIISKGRFPKFDSLAETLPIAQLAIEDINSTDQLMIKIFPSLPGQNYHLAIQGHKMMVIDGERVKIILPSLSDFLQE